MDTSPICISNCIAFLQSKGLSYWLALKTECISCCEHSSEHMRSHVFLNNHCLFVCYSKVSTKGGGDSVLVVLMLRHVYTPHVWPFIQGAFFFSFRHFGILPVSHLIIFLWFILLSLLRQLINWQWKWLGVSGNGDSTLSQVPGPLLDKTWMKLSLHLGEDCRALPQDLECSGF